MIDFGRWWMPVQYASILQEHAAVRAGCGLFDISHMGEIRVSGPDSIQSLNQLLTNDLAKLAPGQAQYSLMCNERGGVIDDLYAYHVVPGVLLLVVNASHIEEDFQWMQTKCRGKDLRLENVSSRTAALALQGPKAAALLDRLAPHVSQEVARNQVVRRTVLGHELFIARTGYTGEDGFELFMFHAGVRDIWRELHSLGATPCGLGARDTLRLEMCYPLYGNDLTPETTPIEAGLGFFVALDKPGFIGKETLQRQKQAGTEKRLVAFTMNERGAIPRPHYRVLRDGEPIGKVTSGSMSPSLQIGIGMGYVESKVAGVGESIEVEIRGKGAPATIVKKPFYKRA